MVYANNRELAEYLGILESALPSDSVRLLTRASEDVDYLTLGRIDQTDFDQLEAAKRATCAQVEMWISAGEDSAIRGPVQSYSIGKVSMTFAGSGGGGAAGGEARFAPRMMRILQTAGFLYRGGSLGPEHHNMETSFDI